MITVFALMIPGLSGQLMCRARPGLRMRPAQMVLLAVAVAVQLTAGRFPAAARYLVPLSFVLGTVLIVSIFWSTGRRVAPAVVASVGATLNTIPIVRWGAMPVEAGSRAAAMTGPIREPGLLAGKHQELLVAGSWRDPSTLLVDRIPVPFAHAVISVGDIVLFVAFILLACSVRASRPERDQAAVKAENRATDGSLPIPAA
ncbi:MAG: DUF5317 family protein [Acidimicrobiales bacterium]